jgi:hypothetical protein
LLTGGADEPFLSEYHLQILRNESAISPASIARRGYRTITRSEDLEPLGFAVPQRCVPGLLLPLWGTDGNKAGYVYRPDSPRVIEEKKKGRLPDGTYPCRVIKYEFPKGASMRVDCPPTCRVSLGDPSVPLWVTEGQKKADALASKGLCAIALLGVWNFKGRNPFGGSTVLADFDYIAWHDMKGSGREVRIVFDSDVMTKLPVRQALDRLTRILQNKGARVTAVYLPKTEKGKQGVDDFFASGHTLEELETLVDAPRTLPRAAAMRIELLEEEPPTVRRPMQLVGGRGYAAIWPSTRETHTEKVLKSGEVIHLNEADVRYKRRLFLVREDGHILGDGVGGVDMTFREGGVEVQLDTPPPPNKLWSVRGVNAYRRGERPDPGGVFTHVADVIDRFIDFDLSIAPQRTMAELIGCYVLATWLLDAFHVVGFLWPNGMGGSGKTHLLTTVCEMAYLGQVVLSGASLATLRDLADSGACLAFDDAEGLADARSSDPDKRALLLAGNRKGNTMPVKEPAADKKWQTRYVNTFCPRLFSAIKLPDPVLASRAIIVPLVRSADRKRANANPLDHATWPHDHNRLQDDLWALALANLSKMASYESRAVVRSTLAGRALEPWRAILAVALWLDEKGVQGLFNRMDTLSRDYQRLRQEFETLDLTKLVVQALVELVVERLKCLDFVGEVEVEVDEVNNDDTLLLEGKA